MSVVIDHWLFQKVKLNVLVEKETDCAQCGHWQVCSKTFESFCKNFEFGCAPARGCQACLHRFTRWHTDPIPCFECKHFTPNSPPVETTP